MNTIRTHHIVIAKIGTILFEHSRRARRLSISVRPFKGVRVAMPKGVSLARAAHFVAAKTGWIRKHLNRIERLEKEYLKTTASRTPLSREVARKRLLLRLDQLAAAHGFTYNRASFRNQRTRWGSCSADNNISLNLKLLMLPDELTDLIIIHELVHTRIKNHSREFWDTLAAIIPDCRLLDRRMKQYNLLLLAPEA